MTYEEHTTEEIILLLEKDPYSSTELRRIFSIYNNLAGKKVRACRCAGKIEAIRKYLQKYIDEQ